MQEKETEYTRKIDTYSKHALEVIIPMITSLTIFKKIRQIVVESETEEEAVRKLKELQSTTLTETEQQK